MPSYKGPRAKAGEMAGVDIPPNAPRLVVRSVPSLQNIRTRNRGAACAALPACSPPGDKGQTTIWTLQLLDLTMRGSKSRDCSDHTIKTLSVPISRFLSECWESPACGHYQYHVGQAFVGTSSEATESKMMRARSNSLKL